MIKFILLQNFELGTWVYGFGKKFVLLRASRIIFPTIIFCAIFIVGDPYTFTFYWWHTIFYAILAFVFWMGFLHYRFFPYEYADLTNEQKYFHLSGIRNGSIPPYKLTTPQIESLRVLTFVVEKKYAESRWHRLRNWIPLIVGIAQIVAWYIYWI